MSRTTWSSTSSATPRVPSPTLPSYRTWTYTTLRSASCSPKHTENIAITAIRKACQSVSRHCLSCSKEPGNLWEKEMSISQLVLVSRETSTVLTASFLKTPKLRKWSIEQGNLWEKSSNAQIRTLLDEERQMIIAEYFWKVSHHEFQAARAEEERRILQEELWRQQKRIFVKFINKVLLRWRNYENSRVLPSIRSQDGSSSRTRILLWNYQEDYKNCKMK